MRCSKCGKEMTTRQFKDGKTYYVCMDCMIKGREVSSMISSRKGVQVSCERRKKVTDRKHAHVCMKYCTMLQTVMS